MNILHEKFTVKLSLWGWINLCRCVRKARRTIDARETVLEQITHDGKTYYVDKKKEGKRDDERAHEIARANSP